MRTVDFFVRGKDKYLPIQFAKEMLGNILPVLRVDSSKRCIDNKRQGTAADILKLAINRILCGLPERAWLKPILQIHDELTFIIPKDKLKGDLVKITGTKYYNGKAVPGWVKNKNWYVHSLKGDRVVINESEDGKNAIMSPVNIKDLALVGAAPKETYRVHTVVKGDTLWEISAKYLGKGNRYPEIKELNNLTSNVIYSGMKLKIPN